MTPPRRATCSLSETLHLYKELREALERLARLHGFRGRSDYIRFVLENHVYGHGHRLEVKTTNVAPSEPLREAKGVYGGRR